MIFQARGWSQFSRLSEVAVLNLWRKSLFSDTGLTAFSALLFHWFIGAMVLIHDCLFDILLLFVIPPCSMTTILLRCQEISIVLDHHSPMEDVNCLSPHSLIWRQLLIRYLGQTWELMYQNLKASDCASFWRCSFFIDHGIGFKLLLSWLSNSGSHHSSNVGPCRNWLWAWDIYSYGYFFSPRCWMSVNQSIWRLHNLLMLFIDNFLEVRFVC